MSKYILNTIYLKPKYVKDEYAPPNSEFALKGVADDALIMVIKDDETNTRELKIIERPSIEYYTVKPEFKDKVNPWQELYMKKDMVDTHEVEYSKRDYDICNYLDITPEYKNLKSRANKHYFDYQEARRAQQDFKDFMNNKIYMSPYVYSDDENIEVYWKTKMMNENNWLKTPAILNVSFYDIETFIAHAKTQVDQNNPQVPVNIITYCNTKYKHFYALVLRLDEIKDVQKEVEDNIDKYINEYVKEDFKDSDMSINIKFFDSEIMLIKAFFQLINDDKPDFALAWNNNYDNKFMMGRIKLMGGDPADFFCHPDIPEEYRRFSFIEDSGRKDTGTFTKKKKGEFSRMWDWIMAPSYTCYIDQMSLYSNLRKRSIEKSYKLDNIAEKEVGANKVDLHDFGLTIRNAVLKNFKIFLKYSMRDTFLLYKIEEKNHDLDNYIALTDNTDLRNGIHESLVIRNTFLLRYVQEGKVIGNTVDYGVDEKIQGAVVQDPTLVEVDPIKINGANTRIFKNVVDWDAKSLYPSLICQHQIGKENHRYRVVSITDKNGKYVMAGDRYNSLLQTLDVSIFDMGKELYGLPSIEEVVTDIEDKLKKSILK